MFPPLYGPVVQLGVHAGLSSRRSRVQIPSGPQCGCPTRKGGPLTSNSGQIAQSVERTPEKREVVGSIPTLTTSIHQRKRPAGVPGGKTKMSICGNGGGNREISDREAPDFGPWPTQGVSFSLFNATLG